MNKSHFITTLEGRFFVTVAPSSSVEKEKRRQRTAFEGRANVLQVLLAFQKLIFIRWWYLHTNKTHLRSSKPSDKKLTTGKNETMARSIPQAVSEVKILLKRGGIYYTYHNDSEYAHCTPHWRRNGPFCRWLYCIATTVETKEFNRKRNGWKNTAVPFSSPVNEGYSSIYRISRTYNIMFCTIIRVRVYVVSTESDSQHMENVHYVEWCSAKAGVCIGCD